MSEPRGLQHRGRQPARDRLVKHFPEWILFDKILANLPPGAEVLDLGSSQSEEFEFPLIAVKIGSDNPSAPTLSVMGGVHGLERIGAQVALSLLGSLSELLLWDKVAQHAMQHVRVVFFPLVNPIGVLNKQRSNPQGVDLMRNAPVDAHEAPTFMVGGHRYGNFLPWFRGHHNQEMQPENLAVMKIFNQYVMPSPTAISLDLHSGFGINDRIWFPWAKTKEPFPHLAHTYALKEALDRTFPHHFYTVEPQSLNYTTHGDLWDYTYLKYYEAPENKKNVYLPLTLEMGSWMWVRKNPMQFFSVLGPYNPVKPHRQKRILRRHNTLFDFLIRSLISPDSWASLNPEQLQKNHERAMEYWYSPEKHVY